MKIDILTLFPEMFEGPFSESMIKRAQEDGLVEINIRNIRDWATDKHSTVDDKPYGGGAGMVLRVDVIHNAINDLKSEARIPKFETNSKLSNNKPKTILLSPQGTLFNQQKASELSKKSHLILIAGHYEGFDERIRKHLIDEEISVGDYVLTGGELPAMIVTDSIVRLIPGVLGDEKSLKSETHSEKGFVKYPVFTRPEKFKEWTVPKVLLSGNHAEIKKWYEKNNH